MLTRYLKEVDDDKTDDRPKDEEMATVKNANQKMGQPGVNKDESKFNTIFRDYLSSKDIIDFTDDNHQNNDEEENCSLSIYTNRRHRDTKGSRASSVQEEYIIQGEEANIFVDFDEFLTGGNAKQFKTYDNSPHSDLIIMENCIDSEDGESPGVLGCRTHNLEGKLIKKNLARCSSRDGHLTPPFKLAHALSKVSTLTDGSTSRNNGHITGHTKPFSKKQGNSFTKQSFIKNQIKALLDYHVQRQGLPLPGKKAMKK